MKTKNNKKKILNFTKANDKMVFDIMRSLHDIKVKHPNLVVKIIRS
jgi:hypothetical protein